MRPEESEGVKDGVKKRHKQMNQEAPELAARVRQIHGVVADVGVAVPGLGVGGPALDDGQRMPLNGDSANTSMMPAISPVVSGVSLFNRVTLLPPSIQQHRARVHAAISLSRFRSGSPAVLTCTLRGCVLSRLSISGQVRHDPQEALHQHQLSPMVHFVFFGPDEHLETGFHCPARLANLFGQQ